MSYGVFTTSSSGGFFLTPGLVWAFTTHSYHTQMRGEIGSTQTLWCFVGSQSPDDCTIQNNWQISLIDLIDRFAAITVSNLFLKRYKANELQVWKHLNSPFYFKYLTLDPPSLSLCTGNPCKDVLPPLTFLEWHKGEQSWIVRSWNKLQRMAVCSFNWDWE